MSRERKLTERQRRFVEEYLVDANAAQAAVRAGFSKKECGSAGGRLLRHLGVKEAVRKAMAERSERLRITADQVLREYARIAFADIRKFAGRGTAGLKDVAELSDEEAAAVVELSGPSDGKGLRVKLHDKKKALDALARHLGLFTRGAAEVENPTAAAERIRELIRARHARLVGHGGTE